MERVVLPEYLDTLPPDDPGARANRRELRAFNFYLGMVSWFRRRLIPCVFPGDRLLEIGAGEGYLISQVFGVSRKRQIADTRWTALDASPVFKGGKQIRFVVGDLLQYDGYPEADIVFGNMILHQFEPAQLTMLGNLWNRHARVLVFQEPRRSRFTHALCRIATLPMSQVSRHDAAVSIRAGFVGNELPTLLGLSKDYWNLDVKTTLRGAYRMVATRK